MTTKTAQQKSVTLTELKALGFNDDVVAVPRRLIVSEGGREKTGKSHFALTAPGPIFYFNIDVGTEGVVGKFQSAGKKVYVYDVRVPKGERQAEYQKLYSGFRTSVEKVYKYNEGTLVMDTSTEGFELARLAHFGKLTQVMPHHYTEVNSEWREFIRLAYDSTMNTILIHKLKPKYINNARTNEMETAGFGETAYLVQANLVCYKEKDENGQYAFSVLVEDCRQNMTVAGTVLRGPMCNFESLLDIVHG